MRVNMQKHVKSFPIWWTKIFIIHCNCSSRPFIYLKKYQRIILLLNIVQHSFNILFSLRVIYSFLINIVTPSFSVLSFFRYFCSTDRCPFLQKIVIDCLGSIDQPKRKLWLEAFLFLFCFFDEPPHFLWLQSIARHHWNGSGNLIREKESHRKYGMIKA